MTGIALYELAKEYRGVADTLADMDLDAQAVADTLEGAGGDLEVKAQNVVAAGKHLRAVAAAKKEAAKAMAESAARLEKRADAIEDYTLNCMQIAGIQKIECPWFTISIAKNPKSVVIDEPGLIPAAYMTDPKPPAPAPDKTLIKKAIEDGFDVAGAHLEQRVRLKVS